MNKTEKVIQTLTVLIREEDLYKKDSKDVHITLANEAKSQHNEWNENPEYKALDHYIGSGFSTMNKHLRGLDSSWPADDFTKNNISSLKKLTSHKTSHSFTAFRGTKNSLGDFKEGDHLKDKAFVSTTINKNMIAHPESGFTTSKGHKFKIHIPEGTKGYYASGHRGISPIEKEFVLHPGTTFKVGHDENDEDGNKWTHLHIHSQED